MSSEDYKKYLFRKHYIECSMKDKIMFVKKPIEIKEFLQLKEIARKMNIKDIRVN